MRAIVVTEYGGPEALVPTEAPAPLPGPGEVVVRTAAAGVNFIDTHQRSGRYRVPLPFVPGQEGAGTVAALGAGAEGVRVGDRVGWVNVPGAYAEQAAVPAERCVPLPDGVGPADAACLLLQGLTAHYLVTDTHPVRPGQTVLVHAAAGGMGQLITRMARLRDARVIGTVSTAEKEPAARGAGADTTVLSPEPSAEEGLDRRVRELTGGRGVHAVYDGVGAATFDASLRSLRPRGVLALYGQASGAVPPVDPRRLAEAGSVFLTRPDLDHHIATRAELLTRADEVFGWFRDGALPTNGATALPLDRAEHAHTALEARRTTGKLLLRTGEPDGLHR